MHYIIHLFTLLYLFFFTSWNITLICFIHSLIDYPSLSINAIYNNAWLLLASLSWAGSLHPPLDFPFVFGWYNEFLHGNTRCLVIPTHMAQHLLVSTVFIYNIIRMIDISCEKVKLPRWRVHVVGTYAHTHTYAYCSSSHNTWITITGHLSVTHLVR